MRAAWLPWLVLAAAVLTTLASLAAGQGARSLLAPLVVAALVVVAFALAGRRMANRRGRDEKEGIVVGIAAYALLGLVQTLALPALLRLIPDATRISTASPSAAGLVYAFLLWPYQWIGALLCLAGVPCT